MSTTSEQIDSVLAGTSASTQERVCIALPAKGRDYDEMGYILSRVVQELGYSVQIIRDGSRAVLDCDVLIMFGVCSAFARSAELLTACGPQRPASILWHIEPLLPDILPEAAERTCRMLAKCDWRKLPGPLSAVIRRVPGSSLLRNTARTTLSSRLRRLCGWNTQTSYTQVPTRQWYHAALYYMWFRQGHATRWCDLVAVSTLPRHQVLTRMGIQCEYAALGYHSAWGRDLGLNRDIDVLFLGRVRKTARERAFAHIHAQLKHQGIELTTVDQDCYGQDRTELLSRTRISLDLTQHPWEMPIARLLPSMACGALVISNWTGDPHPFREEHLVRAESHCLADAVLHYLGTESEQRRIAEAAQRYVTNELAWHGTVRRLLHICRQRSVAKGVVV